LANHYIKEFLPLINNEFNLTEYGVTFPVIEPTLVIQTGGPLTCSGLEWGGGFFLGMLNISRVNAIIVI
jgi:hypothetical protein